MSTSAEEMFNDVDALCALINAGNPDAARAHLTALRMTLSERRALLVGLMMGRKCNGRDSGLKFERQLLEDV